MRRYGGGGRLAARPTLLAGEAAQVADQKQVLEVAGGRGESLEVLERLATLGLVAWSAEPAPRTCSSRPASRSAEVRKTFRLRPATP